MVLPLAMWAEKDGLLVNRQGRLQALRAAIARPGTAREDWRVLAEWLGRLGAAPAAATLAALRRELAAALELAARDRPECPAGDGIRRAGRRRCAGRGRSLMAFVLETLAKIGFMLAFMLSMLPVLIWAERKGAAFIQDRTGPNRASVLGLRLGGLVHPIADVLKLVFKEDVVPARAHKFLHSLAPFIVMTVALSTFAVIPFGDFLEAGGRRVPLIVADLNAGILYVFAVASLGTYGIVIGGWAANNKYTFLGAVRSGAQMISYEISMGLALMGLLLIFSSFSLMDIVRGQGHLLWGFLPMWGVVVQPLGALLFITAVYAETNRTPFDLPEGDSELVAGYHLEYSSLKFALFFMAEYCNMIVGAALITTLFFGGWQIPWLPRARLVAQRGAAADRHPGCHVRGRRLVRLAARAPRPAGTRQVRRCPRPRAGFPGRGVRRRGPRGGGVAGPAPLDDRSGRGLVLRDRGADRGLPGQDDLLRLAVHLGALDPAAFPL